MIFSFSNDGFVWSLNFGPDPVALTVKDLFKEMTKSSREIPLGACSLLLSHFLNNHLARVPITTIEEETMEMRDKVLSSVGAQDMDTSV